MFLKLLLISIVIYWGAKLLKNFINPIHPNQEKVRGKPQKEKPLDFSNQDIEDAEFEDLDE